MKRHSVLIGAFLLLLAPGVADAGIGILDDRATCNRTNCNATRIRGFYQPTEPFMIQVFAEDDECLRVDIVKQSTDLTTTVISPNAAVWRNGDGSSACTLCPLVKIDPTPVSGWYTLVVTHTSGGGTAGWFAMRYGRYRSGNRNCDDSTEVLSAGATDYPA